MKEWNKWPDQQAVKKWNISAVVPFEKWRNKHEHFSFLIRKKLKSSKSFFVEPGGDSMLHPEQYGRDICGLHTET